MYSGTREAGELSTLWFEDSKDSWRGTIATLGVKEMTFDEIPLYEAIHEVYRTVDNPRSDAWLIEPQRMRLLRLIQAQLPLDSPFSSEEWQQCWSAYGRSRVAEAGVQLKKIELAILVARVHGRRCFFFSRGLGDCSSEVNLDRIIPGARHGQYTLENCILSCSFHNTQRRERSIEEYLLTGSARPSELLRE